MRLPASRRRLFPLMLIALLAPACTGGQVGEEGVACVAVDTQPLDRDQVGPLGFTADELLEQVAGEFTGTMEWADDTSSPGSLSLSYDDGVIEFQDREWNDEDAAEVDDGACADVLVVGVQAVAATEDGRLDEAWDVELEATAAEAAVFAVRPAEYTGSLDVASFAPTDGDVSSDVSAELGPDDASLILTGLVARTDGDTASAEVFDIGTLDATRP